MLPAFFFLWFPSPFLPPDPYPELPPIVDLARFPSARVCAEQWQRWRMYRDWLRGRDTAPLSYNQRLQLEREIVWASHYHDAWDAIDDAHRRASWCTNEARRHLARLHVLIGTLRYDLGVLPMRLPDLHYHVWPD